MAESSTSKLTRGQLEEEIAAQADVTLHDAHHIVGIILDSMVRALRSGDKVEIRGFGSFRTHTREQRMGRNPKTGAKVAVPPKIVPHFKASKELLALVNAAAIGEPLASARDPE